ncbi:hypothetical protein EV424DRAFT_302813 [Suillus variegatus]|nr:hypothetical protein EV424DRAFT_302813 [Suillus variegatus]
MPLRLLRLREVCLLCPRTHASPPNLRLCWSLDSSADVYQTCPKLSMNTQAPAARYIALFLSTNERGRRRLSSANTQSTYCSVAQFIRRATIFPRELQTSRRPCRASRDVTHSRGRLTFCLLSRCFKDQ